MLDWISFIPSLRKAAQPFVSLHKLTFVVTSSTHSFLPSSRTLQQGRVRDIHGKITEEDCLVSTHIQHIQTLFSLLKTLNDKGQVLLLQSSEDQADCFVVLKMGELLHEVNGTLFAPHQFRQHKDFVNSTDMTMVKFSYFQSSELIPKIPEEWGGVKDACALDYFYLVVRFLSKYYVATSANPELRFFI